MIFISLKEKKLFLNFELINVINHISDKTNLLRYS